VRKEGTRSGGREGCGVRENIWKICLRRKGKDGGKEARKYEKGRFMYSKEGTIAVNKRRYSIQYMYSFCTVMYCGAQSEHMRKNILT